MVNAVTEILLINRRARRIIASPEWDMATHSQSDLHFEIGHVLFIDIAGYSKLLINEQSELIRQLREVVRGTEQFRRAEAEGKLLRLPTGDGGCARFS
jgi:hypothetical protein